MLKLSPRHPIRQEVAKLATLDYSYELDYSYDLDYSYGLDYSYDSDYSYVLDYSNDLDYSKHIVNPSKPRKTIQLERIRDSISGLYDLRKLEKIQHFHFKP